MDEEEASKDHQDQRQKDNRQLTRTIVADMRKVLPEGSLSVSKCLPKKEETFLPQQVLGQHFVGNCLPTREEVLFHLVALVEEGKVNPKASIKD